MSLSTTATTTFELIKYSRAYSQSTHPAQAELEWQHFVNPVIRLMLDTKKAPDGRLESYKIRIVWTFGAGQDSMDVDRREMTFEDLELMSYSALPPHQPAQGMPLKAVYQGPVVGLRYQYPCTPSPGATPQYRRFQITFQNESSATNFIDCIRFVCPCKPNAGPPPRVARVAEAGRAATTARTAMSAPPAPAANLRQTMSTLPVDVALSTTFQQRSTTALPRSSSLNKLLNWGTPAAGGQPATPATPSCPASDSRPSSAVTVSSVLAQHSTSDPPAPDAFANRPVLASHANSSDADTALPSPSLPSSSPLPPSSRPAAAPLRSAPALMPPPPIPPQASLPHSTQHSQATPTPTPTPRTGSSNTLATMTPPAIRPDLSSDIAATLRDSDGLYTLPKEDLEKLVAEVIREEGFVELMRSLDGMWKIKGLAGIHSA